jgi:type III secretory pathway component EscS
MLLVEDQFRNLIILFFTWGVVPLLPIFVVSLLLAFIQTAMQLQEQTITFIIKIVGLILFFLILGNNAWEGLVEFTTNTFIDLNKVTR